MWNPQDGILGITPSQAASYLHERGNAEFARGEFGEALRSFQTALENCGSYRGGGGGDELSGAATKSGNSSSGSSSRGEARELRIALLLNISLTQMRLGEFEEALRCAEEALELDGMSLKARYRRAIALSRLGRRLGLAYQELRMVADMVPYNAQIHEELQHLRQRVGALPEAAEMVGDGEEKSLPPPLVVVTEERKTQEQDLRCSLCQRYGSIRGCKYSCSLDQNLCRGGKHHVLLVTICEVKRHCIFEDCWLVQRGNVFQANSFINTHPGGQRCILKRCGQLDCSEDYDFHSHRARQLWDSMKIGVLVNCNEMIKNYSGESAAMVATAKRDIQQDGQSGCVVC